MRCKLSRAKSLEQILQQVKLTRRKPRIESLQKSYTPISQVSSDVAELLGSSTSNFIHLLETEGEMRQRVEQNRREAQRRKEEGRGRGEKSKKVTDAISNPKQQLRLAMASDMEALRFAETTAKQNGLEWLCLRESQALARVVSSLQLRENRQVEVDDDDFEAKAKEGKPEGYPVSTDSAQVVTLLHHPEALLIDAREPDAGSLVDTLPGAVEERFPADVDEATQILLRMQVEGRIREDTQALRVLV